MTNTSFIKLGLSIEGVRQVSIAFDVIGRQLDDFTRPLNEVKGLMLGAIAKNYETEGAWFGVKWKRLNKAYERVKSVRYAGRQILEKTGLMKRSFYGDVGRKSLIIGNDVAYFKFHQSKKPRRVLPRRIMLKIHRREREEISRAFTRFLNKITHG